jgi:hypothetical protein
MIQLVAMTVTLAIEIPIALAFGRLTRLNTVWWRLAAISAAATLLTHPFVWLIISDWMKAFPFWQRCVVAETFALLAEAVIYWRFTTLTPVRAFVLSLLANGVSFAMGFPLRDWILEFGSSL